MLEGCADDGARAGPAAVPDGLDDGDGDWQLTQDAYSKTQSDSEVPLDVREAFPQACDGRKEVLGAKPARESSYAADL